MTLLRTVEVIRVTTESGSAPVLQRALGWFTRSGIQEPSGGVARYHLLAEARNLPVSTEITGYAVSALLWGGETQAGLRAADFLVRDAWRPDLQAMPFEIADPLPPSYFFDCGIIVRGLLAAWRVSGQHRYLAVARDLGIAMGRDFVTPNGPIHPVLALPSKLPLPYEPRWSREPGCFQLKSAMAWANLGALFPGEAFLSWWEQALHHALATHLNFLPGTADDLKIMDRLHAYCYFLEALLCRADRPACREALAIGVDRVAGYLRAIGPRFERSDVCAQLLRVRLLAGRYGALPLDANAAEEEAALCAAHQRFGGPPMEDGGFCFGSRNGASLPYMNPVSTSFAMQALTWWQQWQSRELRASIDELI